MDDAEPVHPPLGAVEVTSLHLLAPALGGVVIQGEGSVGVVVYRPEVGVADAELAVRAVAQPGGQEAGAPVVAQGVVVKRRQNHRDVADEEHHRPGHHLVPGVDLELGAPEVVLRILGLDAGGEGGVRDVDDILSLELELLAGGEAGFQAGPPLIDDAAAGVEVVAHPLAVHALVTLHQHRRAQGLHLPRRPFVNHRVRGKPHLVKSHPGVDVQNQPFLGYAVLYPARLGIHGEAQFPGDEGIHEEEVVALVGLPLRGQGRGGGLLVEDRPADGDGRHGPRGIVNDQPLGRELGQKDEADREDLAHDEGARGLNPLSIIR